MIKYKLFLLVFMFGANAYLFRKNETNIIRNKRSDDIGEKKSIDSLIEEKIENCKKDVNCCKKLENWYSKFTEVVEIRQVDFVAPFVCFEEKQMSWSPDEYTVKPPVGQPTSRPSKITNKFLKDKQTINQYYTPIVQNFQAPVNYFFWPQWDTVLPDDNMQTPGNPQNVQHAVNDDLYMFKSAIISDCVNESRTCNGMRDCMDGTDEMRCSCKSRIDESRYCDGIFDCPDGDDEIGCFGCNNSSFNCDNWMQAKKRAGKVSGNCVLKTKRCDGTINCLKTGKDEKECVLLSETVDEHNFNFVSLSIGFLHANYKGKWYPVCFTGKYTKWEISAANEVCQNELGPQTSEPLLYNFEPSDGSYSGIYLLSSHLTGKLHLSRTCPSNNITYVVCPTINCGTRMYKKVPENNENDPIEDEIFELFGFDRLKYKRQSSSVHSSQYERIVGGIASSPAAWPWVVTIYRNGLFHCGGIILNDLWIMSAAHCVEKYWLYYFEAQAGVLRRFSYSPQEQNRVVTNVVEHQNYDRQSMHNDLSLLRVDRSFHFNKWVRPICLPAPSTNPAPGTICTAVGWGATQERGLDPDHMRHVELPILKQCKHRIDLEGNELCAGYPQGGKDSCQGDSGGPLLCKVPDQLSQWYVAGIVSHGEGCARPNEPGVYTRVSLYSSWIKIVISTNIKVNTTKPLKRCPGFYCDDSNKCIARRKRCDRIVDCLDGSDEMDCDDDHTLKLLKKHSAINHIEFIKKSQSDTSDYTTVFPVENNDNGFDQTIVENKTKVEQDEYFLCKIIEQLIPKRLKCNQKIDCEDSSDEMLCSCRNYLENSHDDALCDGVTDCKDLTDEFHSDCNLCEDHEFRCGQDQKCIPLNKRCNRVVDCKSEEDEWNCFALSDLDIMKFDADSKPLLKKYGTLVHNSNGRWYPLCISENQTRDIVKLADDICSYLGFHGYVSYQTRNVPHLALNETGRVFLPNESSDEIPDCSTLQVICSSQSYLINKETDDDFIIHDFISARVKENYIYPWNVAIYIEGRYACTGVLIDIEWAITELSCFHDIETSQAYISTRSGIGKGYLNIQGPYEQLIQTSDVIQVQNSNIVMLKLSNKISITRHSKPIRLAKQNEFLSEVQLCLATGVNFKNEMVAIALKFLQNSDCGSNQLCFERINANIDYCHMNGTLSPWNGVITCLTEYGWLPAATFSEPFGECGFTNQSNFFDINPHISNITDNLNRKITMNGNLQLCDGFRCKLGNCIPLRNLCDNVSDCLESEDENDRICAANKAFCNMKNNDDPCHCKNWEIRCNNGKCVSKNVFMNYENDCGDWSDEPKEKTCSSYLSLTTPDLICNGVRNCFDKSDESPNECPCTPKSFVCDSTQYKNNFCIPMDFVCDGDDDCPNSEDEKNCFTTSLNHTEVSQNGILSRKKMGIWSPLCLNLTEEVEQKELHKICAHMGMNARVARAEFIEGYVNLPIIEAFTRIKLNNITQLIMRKSKTSDVTISNRIFCRQMKVFCS